MTASISITLSDDILRILDAEKEITLEIDSTRGSARGGRTHAAPAADRAAPEGDYRAGSLPGKLVKWAQGRKRPFGVRDVMKTLRVKRAHASMVLTRVMSSGHLRRVGRGSYASA